MSDDEKTYTHESYGQVSFTRVQCSGERRLYGSPLTTHMNTIRLRIHRSERIHRLSHDRYHEGARLIEVELSAAQFAELLTTMNAGAGVPCTINSIGGKTMEEPPPVETEAEAVRSGFRERTAKIVAETRAWREEVEAALDNAKGLTKATRDLVMGGVDRVFRHVSDSAPFVVDMFQEATTRVVTSAKAEVEAFVLHNVIQAGLAHVRSFTAGQPEAEVNTNLLGPGDGEDS